MTRLFLLFAALVLYVAPPAAQAFASFHVRLPGAALVQPSSADTELTRDADTELPWGVIAAWVQAVGTIAAFGGAIYFSSRDHRRSINIFAEERRREEGIRHLRAHSLAHALYPDLIEVKAKIKLSEGAISRQRAQGNRLPHNLIPPGRPWKIFGPDFLTESPSEKAAREAAFEEKLAADKKEAAPVIASRKREITQYWKIDIPEGFRSAGERFYLLGTDTAPVVSQLLSLLHQHNGAAGELIDKLNDERTAAKAWAMLVDNRLFANRFPLMKDGVEKALQLVMRIRNKDLLPEYTLKAKNDQKDNIAPDGTATNSDDTAPS